MISLGILTLHPYIHSDYATRIGKQSKKYSIRVYRFHPFNWNPKTNQVTGDVFDHLLNDWKPGTFTLPTFIYDRCFYSNSLHSEEFSVVQVLKQKANFLSNGLPNKWRVYEILARYPSVAPFLPKTIKVTKKESIVHPLFKQKKLVLKPINGAHGKGIFFIELLHSKQLFIQTHRNGKNMTKTISIDNFADWYFTTKIENRYIAQPFLQLTNAKKEPCDVRVLVQKNEKGNWKEVGRGVRIGKRGNFVSNLHNGGKVRPFLQKWKQNRKFNQQLETLINVLPTILEQHFHPLFELGIDIGVEPTGQCWLLEVNSKPGYRTILPECNLNRLSDQPLRYCLYLRKELFKHEINRANDYIKKKSTDKRETAPSPNIF